MKMKEELSPETNPDAKQASSAVETIVMWRSIEDGLPEIELKHLCLFDNGKMEVGKRLNNNIWVIGNRFDWDYKEKVTYWAELPEPPQAT